MGKNEHGSCLFPPTFLPPSSNKAERFALKKKSKGKCKYEIIVILHRFEF